MAPAHSVNTGIRHHRVYATSVATGYATPATPTPISVAFKKDRTPEIVKGLRLLLELHKAGSQVVNDMAQQVSAYLEAGDPSEGVWFKRAKYLLVLPMSIYLRNDRPKQPDQVALTWSGSFGAWMRNRLRLVKVKNTHLWYSWLQGKRCSIKLTPSLVEAAYQKHYETLTRPDPLTPEEASNLIESCPAFVKFLNYLSERVAEDVHKDAERSRFQNGPDGCLRAASTVYSQSTSACFESTRANYGASGEMYRDAFKAEISESRYTDSELVRMDYRFVLGHQAFHVVQQRGHFRAVDLHRIRRSPHPLAAVDCTLLREVLLTLGIDKTVWELRQIESSQWEGLAVWQVRDRIPSLQAMIQAVLEPLKIRIISKGNAWQYYGVKSLQKSLHGQLRVIPAFQLIGRVLQSSDLDRLRTFAGPDDQWASVDYSAATDGLSSNLGLSILRRLVRGLPAGDQQDALRVLGHHDLYYPNNPDAPMAEKLWRGGRDQVRGTAPVGEQTNGQLMGSPLSFPVLCLANFLVFLLVHPHLSLEEALQRVLVNGDDMLYTGTRATWDKHVKIAGSVGLEMSPGKAYLHPLYANANSTSFHCNLRSTEPCRQIGYLNTGLFYGKHKVMGDDRLGESEPIETVLNVITAGCHTEQMQQEVLRRAMCLYREDLMDRLQFRVQVQTTRGYSTRVCRRNLFLARSAGGAGVNPCGLKHYISDHQKLLALIRLEEQTSRPGPYKPWRLDTIADDAPCDLAVEWASSVKAPWTTASSLESEMETLRLASVDYKSVGRNWRDFGEHFARHEVSVVGTSRSAIWLC